VTGENSRPRYLAHARNQVGSVDDSRIAAGTLPSDLLAGLVNRTGEHGLRTDPLGADPQFDQRRLFALDRGRIDVLDHRPMGALVEAGTVEPVRQAVSGTAKDRFRRGQEGRSNRHRLRTVEVDVCQPVGGRAHQNADVHRRRAEVIGGGGRVDAEVLPAADDRLLGPERHGDG